MYGVPPQGHHQGQTRDNSNTHFFTLKRNTYTSVLIQHLSYIYMSYHILFEGVCFILPYSTHVLNAYVAGNLLKIKHVKNDACL